MRRGLPTALRVLLGVLAAGLLAGAIAAGPATAASPWWHLNLQVTPTNLPPGGEGQIRLTASDIGDAEVNGALGPATINDILPAGLKVKSVYAHAGSGILSNTRPDTVLKCTVSGQTVSCPFTGTLAPFEEISLAIFVTVERPTGTVETLPNEAWVEGGGAPRAALPAGSRLNVSGEPVPFGVENYQLTPEEEGGSTDSQAGSHPFQLTTSFDLNTQIESILYFGTVPVEAPVSPELPKNFHFVVPPGLIGNALATAKCPGVDFSAHASGNYNYCAPDTAVGVATVTILEPIAADLTASVPVFNLEPGMGEPARFGFEIEGVPVVLSTSVRTGSDYAVEVSVHEAPQSAQVLASQVTLWGVPADPRHDSSRGWECLDHGIWVEGAETPRPCNPLKASAPQSFLTLPTDCGGSPSSTVTGEAWTGGKLEAAFQLPEFNGCNLLRLNPSISVEPESHAASTPTGMTVKIEVPQESTVSSTGLAEADIRDTTLALPVGLDASPGAAGGLLSCSAGQVGFTGFGEGLGEGAQLENDHFTPAAAECPEAAKIGTVAIKTPLLEEELKGSVYLASQDTNPFGSPLVLYLIAEDPVSGVRVKLAGEVAINPANGQLTTTFKETPPLPFEDLTLKLFGGPRASQSTPASCGTYTASASLNPWSGGEPVQASSQFAITSGPGGEPCPPSPLPLNPSFQAGSSNSQAGAFTPFTMTINRPDSNQPLQSVTLHLPPGLAAMISSVTPCGEPQAANNECGAESLVGHSTALAGLGPSPVALGGDVYLTGPYEGAPFGLLVVTHASVGPFHIPDVRVRSRIMIDPTTAAVTVISDPIPEFVKGVPSQIKVLNVTVDRPGFQFNPTNCNPMSVSGTLSGYEGSSAAVSYPFQVSNCASLPFAPKLSAQTTGQASKANGASFNVKITSAGLGQANIAKVDLQLPIVLPTRLTTLQKACREELFEANPATCDEGSVIGYAIVHTPVFKNPLTGPAYLVSHGNAAFPDVEFVLQGEGVTLVIDGKTDIKGGITYSHFETSPDAPFTSFETILPTGPHSALTAYVPQNENYSLCTANLAMPTELTGQNGAVIKQTTTIVATGCGGVLSSKTSLTRPQLLAKALKACRKKKNKAKRVACEKQARKKYGAKTAKHKKKG